MLEIFMVFRFVYLLMLWFIWMIKFFLLSVVILEIKFVVCLDCFCFWMSWLLRMFCLLMIVKLFVLKFVLMGRIVMLIWDGLVLRVFVYLMVIRVLLMLCFLNKLYVLFVDFFVYVVIRMCLFCDCKFWIWLVMVLNILVFFEVCLVVNECFCLVLIFRVWFLLGNVNGDSCWVGKDEVSFFYLVFVGYKRFGGNGL